MRLIILLLGFSTFWFLSSCSAYLASTKNTNVDLRLLKRGTERTNIEKAIGPPESIKKTSEGTYYIYQFETGYIADQQRATNHIIGNMLTLGIHEPIAFITESSRGQLFKATVTYATDNIVDFIEIKPTTLNENATK